MRRNSFTRGGSSVKISPVAHGSFSGRSREEGEIIIELDRSGSDDIGVTEFHTSHGELTQTMPEPSPSLYESLGISTSAQVLSEQKGEGFNTTNEETEDTQSMKKSDESTNQSILTSTSRVLSTLASIVVSVGAILSMTTGKGRSSNQNDNQNDTSLGFAGQEDDDGGGDERKGILHKINKRMATIASIATSIVIVIGTTSPYWESEKPKPLPPQIGNAVCTDGVQCKSGLCGKLNIKNVEKYLGNSSLPLVPSQLQGQEKKDRETFYKDLLKQQQRLNQTVCKCDADADCKALQERDHCHKKTGLCFDEEEAAEPQIGNAVCMSSVQCKSGDCGKLQEATVMAQLDFGKVKGLSRDDAEVDKDILRTFFPALNQDLVCRCKRHETCEKGKSCNNGSGLCFRKEMNTLRPTKGPSIQASTLSPTKAPGTSPTFSPTITMQPTFSTPRIVTINYEVDIEQKVDTPKQFNDGDLCRFSEKMATSTQKYSNQPLGAAENHRSEDTISGCIFLWAVEKANTTCHAYIQHELKPSKRIRVLFEMRWSSYYLTCQQLESLRSSFPQHINDAIVDWRQALLNRGFGAATWMLDDDPKKNIGKFQDIFETIPGASLPKSFLLPKEYYDCGLKEEILPIDKIEPISLSHPIDKIQPIGLPPPQSMASSSLDPSHGVGDNVIRGVAVYTQAFRTTAEKWRFSTLDSLILESDVFPRILLHASTLESNLQNEPAMKMINQTVPDVPEQFAIMVTYQIEWSFCRLGQSEATTDALFGEEIHVIINDLVAEEQFLRELHRAGLRDIVDVLPAHLGDTEIFEDFDAACPLL